MTRSLYVWRKSAHYSHDHSVLYKEERHDKIVTGKPGSRFRTNG